jgi:S-layer protein
VSLIDGSAATGKLSIDLTNVTPATAGIEVKGGSAADTLTTSTFATKLTGGAGADNFVVAAAVANSTSNPVITTITDFTVGTDKITFADQGTETFAATKVDVSTATALFGGTVNALDLAATANGSTNAAITWFQYAGDTYIVEDRSASTTAFTASDIVVKLSGLVDLSTLTVADFNFV